MICSDLGSRRGSEILCIAGPEEYGKMSSVLGGKIVRYLYTFKDTGQLAVNSVDPGKVGSSDVVLFLQHSGPAGRCLREGSGLLQPLWPISLAGWGFVWSKLIQKKHPPPKGSFLE